MTDHTPTKEPPEIGRTIRVLYDPWNQLHGQEFVVEQSFMNNPSIVLGNDEFCRIWDPLKRCGGWQLQWEYVDQPVAEEPTDWRPWSWPEDVLILEFRNGSHYEVDADCYDWDEGWLVDLWAEISDELSAKGIEADDDTETYPPGTHKHLNWRPLSELPEFARPQVDSDREPSLKELLSSPDEELFARNKGGAMERRKAILNEIADERDNQNERYGEGWGDGPTFDDLNTANDWIAYITRHAGKAVTFPWQPKVFRECLIEVAALCVAAIEKLDERSGNLAPRHYDVQR